MDSTDLELEQRVWQRVSGGNGAAAEETENLQAWVLRAEESAADYRSMASRMQGAKRERLLAMSREAAGDAAALRGMCRLSGGGFHKAAPYTPPKEELSRMLGRSYRRSAQTQHDYRALGCHKEYGCIFEQMAQGETGRMRFLLELIGNME